MAVIDHIDYKDMLKFVVDRITSVSTNIFTTSRPQGAVPSMNDFVVVSFPSRVFNHYGFATTTCRVSLYAKDINSQEAVVKLGTMQKAVFQLFPYSNANYEMGQGTILSGGTDGIGYHILHINYQFTIKK